MRQLLLFLLFVIHFLNSIISQPVPGDTNLGSLNDGVVGGGATISDNYFSIIFILFLVSIYVLYKYKSLLVSNISNTYSSFKKGKGIYLKAPSISFFERVIKNQIKNNKLAIK